jgi:hypothetical protein
MTMKADNDKDVDMDMDEMVVIVFVIVSFVDQRDREHRGETAAS